MKRINESLGDSSVEVIRWTGFITAADDVFDPTCGCFSLVGWGPRVKVLGNLASIAFVSEVRNSSPLRIRTIPSLCGGARFCEEPDSGTDIACDFISGSKRDEVL